MESLTPSAKRLRETDKTIYDTYLSMMASPGAMKTAVINRICDIFGVSYSTVYNITKREKQRRETAKP